MQRECGLAAFRWAEARAAEAVFAQFLPLADSCLWEVLCKSLVRKGVLEPPHGFTSQILSSIGTKNRKGSSETVLTMSF